MPMKISLKYTDDDGKETGQFFEIESKPIKDNPELATLHITTDHKGDTIHHVVDSSNPNQYTFAFINLMAEIFHNIELLRTGVFIDKGIEEA